MCYFASVATFDSDRKKRHPAAFVVGFALIAWGVWNGLPSLELAVYGETTVGTVAFRPATKHFNADVVYYVQAQSYRIPANVLGEKNMASVVFLPKNPKVGRVNDFRNMWLSPLVIIAIGATAFIPNWLRLVPKKFSG